MFRSYFLGSCWNEISNHASRLKRHGVTRVSRRTVLNRAANATRAGRHPCGFVTVTNDGRMVFRDWPISSRCDGTLPLPGCFGPELSQRGSRNEVALNIKCIVDGSMDAEKALSGSC